MYPYKLGRCIISKRVNSARVPTSIMRRFRQLLSPPTSERAAQASANLLSLPARSWQFTARRTVSTPGTSNSFDPEHGQVVRLAGLAEQVDANPIHEFLNGQAAVVCGTGDQTVDADRLVFKRGGVHAIGV